MWKRQYDMTFMAHGGGPPVGESVERIVENEATLRRVNEAIEAGRGTRGGTTGFRCECGVLSCNEIVELDHAEYEDVRANARHFIVAKGHALEVDVPVHSGDRYDVVAKREGAPAAYAERTDPRSEPPPA